MHNRYALVLLLVLFCIIVYSAEAENETSGEPPQEFQADSELIRKNGEKVRQHS